MGSWNGTNYFAKISHIDGWKYLTIAAVMALKYWDITPLPLQWKRSKLSNIILNEKKIIYYMKWPANSRPHFNCMEVDVKMLPKLVREKNREKIQQMFWPKWKIKSLKALAKMNWIVVFFPFCRNENVIQQRSPSFEWNLLLGKLMLFLLSFIKCI